MGRLDGKIAIVTGGAGPGIGHGISMVMAREGAFVAILEVDLQAAEIVRTVVQLQMRIVTWMFPPIAVCGVGGILPGCARNL